MAVPAYKRVLLKLSGEALMGDDAYGINRSTISRIVNEVKEIVDLGVQVAVVIGGGNIFRGVAPAAEGMDRATADYMGMLATVMNAMALQDAMRNIGLNARVLSALNIEQVAEPYIRGKAIRYLEEGRVVIFGAGTGNPYKTITFDEAIIKNLKVMDATALTLCRDQKLPIVVFSIFKQGALKKVIMGGDEGSMVTP